MPRIRKHALLLVGAVTASLLVALPASADEGEEGAEPAPVPNEWIASAVSNEFGLTPEATLELYEAGIGWGGIFKLALMSAATGEDPQTLLASVAIGEDGEPEFSWGKWFHSLEESQAAGLEGFARNLGQLISADKRGHGKPAHAGPEAGEGEAPTVTEKGRSAEAPGNSGDHPGNGKGRSGESPGQAKKSAG